MKGQHHELRTTRGFTLMELIIVIGIIALLLAVVLALLGDAKVKRRDTQRVTTLHQIKNALELYYSANGTYPSTSGAFINSTDATWDTSSVLKTGLSQYIAKLSVDPLNNAADPWTAGNYSFSYAFDPATMTTYDLVGQLEASNNKLRCGLRGTTIRLTGATCTAFGGPHSDQMYNANY